jgi:hypothetical protein
VNIQNIDKLCALRESVSFTEEVPLGCALRESVSFAEEVPLGCALRESVSFAEEVPLGCNEAVGADFKKVNSWMTGMTCSEAP